MASQPTDARRKHLKSNRWSSYRAYAGLSKREGWAEELYRNLTRKQGQPLDVPMRRTETPYSTSMLDL
jgi:hypothetical protein